MSNTSGLPQSVCYGTFRHMYTSKNSPAYFPINLAVCVVTAVSAPMTVASNALILAAIWKNPSLRTPSYVLLAGLAVTDFSTGLLTQPAFVVTTVSHLSGNREMSCIANQVAIGLGSYLSTLTSFVIMLSSVERWLYVSRRSFLTVRRVVVLYIVSSLFLLILIGGTMGTSSFWNKLLSKFFGFFLSLSVIGFVVTVFAYFKVFQIIRNHQRQVQTNESNINMRKYRKSIFTILYILAIFVTTYVPVLCCILVYNVLKKNGETHEIVYNVSVALLFSSSFLNPLLYYWRMKDIRNSVRSTIRKLFCNQTDGEES